MRVCTVDTCRLLFAAPEGGESYAAGSQWLPGDFEVARSISPGRGADPMEVPRGRGEHLAGL